MSTLSRQTVRAYLVGTADTEPTYLRARDIADDLDASPKAVAQYLSQLQDDLADMLLEQWGRSKSITWRVEVNES
jgi:predicted transcriptional regulator